MEAGKNRAVSQLLATAMVVLLLSGCGPSMKELRAVNYDPIPGRDWKTASPEEVGLDSLQLARLYYNAERTKTTLSVLVIKDGYLVAEKYFHGGTIDSTFRLQSVTKSITSALTGIALEKGHIESVDQKMMDFFPELKDSIKDPRKNKITLQEMLQMRAGYPWEESNEELFTMLYRGFWPSLIVDVPLEYNPGTDMRYSNLSSHMIGVIVSRKTGKTLEDFADEELFDKLGVTRGYWIKDWEGNNNGHADLHLRARDMAKFGLLYLNEGVFDSTRIISAEWVKESHKIYSEDAWKYRVGRNFKDIGYGYQWWSVRAGNYRYNLAWGHGGQQIAILKDLNMVIVVTSDPLWGQHGGRPWRMEKANLNLVADFVSSLPLATD